jgi:hypothetical protein
VSLSQSHGTQVVASELSSCHFASASTSHDTRGVALQGGEQASERALAHGGTRSTARMRAPIRESALRPPANPPR